MMETRFEAAFLKAMTKHANIKKLIQKKVDMIISNPVAMGEPLRANWQGFYSCPVKRNFIIVYLFCESCRKKGDDAVVACADCRERPDKTIKFVLIAPHDNAYET